MCQSTKPPASTHYAPSISTPCGIFPFLHSCFGMNTQCINDYETRPFLVSLYHLPLQKIVFHYVVFFGQRPSKSSFLRRKVILNESPVRAPSPCLTGTQGGVQKNPEAPGGIARSGHALSVCGHGLHRSPPLVRGPAPVRRCPRSDHLAHIF